MKTKKIIVFVLIVMVVTLLTLTLVACNEREIENLASTPTLDVNAINEVTFFRGDSVVLDEYGEPTVMGLNILLRSDIIVIGEFIGETHTRFIPGLVSGVSRAITFSDLRIIEVLDGDVEIGDIVKVAQNYYIDEENGNFVSYSTPLTPMQSGDRWLMFLGKTSSPIEYFSQYIDYNVEDYVDTYFFSGMFDARFPLPTSETLQLAEYYIENEIAKFSAEIPAELETATLGVFDRDAFNFQLYAEVLEHFQIEPDDDWVNPGHRLDERLVSLYENQAG